MEKEIWKDVPDYEGIYMVSNYGRVKSLDHFVFHLNGRHRIQKGRILKTNKCYKGYLRVSLSKNGKRFKTGCHRLVALAFIPNPKNKLLVNHKNGIKDDNRIDNLEWCSNRENIIHAYKNKLIRVNKGEDHHNSKLTNKQVIELRSKIKKGISGSKLSEEYNLTTTAISKIRQNKTYINIF